MENNNQKSYPEYIAEKRRKEDEAVAKKWERYKSYGRGWIGDIPTE